MLVCHQPAWASCDPVGNHTNSISRRCRPRSLRPGSPTALCLHGSVEDSKLRTLRTLGKCCAIGGLSLTAGVGRRRTWRLCGGSFAALPVPDRLQMQRAVAPGIWETTRSPDRRMRACAMGTRRERSRYHLGAQKLWRCIIQGLLAGSRLRLEVAR